MFSLMAFKPLSPSTPRSVDLPAFFVARTGKIFASFPIASGHHVARIGAIWKRRKKQTKRVKILLSGGSTC